MFSDEDEDVEIDEKPMLDDSTALMAHFEREEHINNGGVKERRQLANGATEEDVEEDEGHHSDEKEASSDLPSDGASITPTSGLGEAGTAATVN